MSSVAAPHRRFPARRVAVALCAAAFVAASILWLGLDLGALASGQTLDALGVVASRLWPPDLGSKTLANMVSGVVQTLSMSIVGTSLGALLGFVLMPFCSEVLFVRGPLVEEDRRGRRRHAAALALHQAARLAANVLRTVPYFVWAVLFWFMVGPGTFTGALAIAVHTGGVIARNYAQALDNVDLRPSLALSASGARRTHVFVFGMLPAARTALLSLTLYRWDVNIRESTVLGLVGAGGLGFHLYHAIGIFDWSAAATHLGAIMALVLGVDFVSAAVRKRLV
jgi:phosphonate transport system permease protein